MTEKGGTRAERRRKKSIQDAIKQVTVGCAEEEIDVRDIGRYNCQYLADKKLCVGKGRSQAHCPVTGRSNWSKCDDCNRNSQRESVKRKKDELNLGSGL